MMIRKLSSEKTVRERMWKRKGASYLCDLVLISKIVRFVSLFVQLSFHGVSACCSLCCVCSFALDAFDAICVICIVWLLCCFASNARTYRTFMNEKLGVNRRLMRSRWCTDNVWIGPNDLSKCIRYRRTDSTVMLQRLCGNFSQVVLVRRYVIRHFTCCFCSVSYLHFTLIVFYCSANICPWLPVATAVINKTDLSKHLQFTCTTPERNSMNMKRNETQDVGTKRRNSIFAV